MKKFLPNFARTILAACVLFLSQAVWSTTCPNASVILPTSLPIVNQSVICGGTDDINTTTIAASVLTGGCNSTLYYGGQEALYSFTPTASGIYDLSYAGQTYTSIFVFNGCPTTSGTTCVGGVSSSTASKAVTITLTAGVTYYILFDTWPTPVSPCPGTFSLTQILPNTATATVNGGLWSSPATWASGVVPNAGSSVVIPSGSIVVVDQITSIVSLSVSGILQWNATANAMTVFANITVNSGGKFLPFTTVAGGTTSATINVGGDFINNGYCNFAAGTTTAGLLNFNGSQQASSLAQTLGGTGVFEGNGVKGIIRSLFFQTTGSSTINTTQDLITYSLAHTGGSLNTNGKITIDNTAQCYGQAINTQVANVTMTNMGTGYNVAPVVFSSAVVPYANLLAATLGTRYFYGNDVYLCTAGGTFNATPPTSTASTTFTTSGPTLIWIGTLGTIGTNVPYSGALSLTTNYFYGNNLYQAIVATATTIMPTHTSGVVGNFRYLGSVAKVAVNYDPTTLTVRSLTLTNSGSGYSSSAAPGLVFSVGVTGGLGSGAAATPNILYALNGPLNSLAQKSGGAATLNGGLTINSDAGAGSLTVDPQASSGVGNISTTYGGLNYSVAPTVGFAGPTAINLVTNAGSGYTVAPTITVTGGTLVSGTALATTNFTITLNQGKVVSVYLNASTTATYSVPPTLAFSSGTATLAFPAGCWPAATASIGSNGQITNFTMTNSGFGYVIAPTVGVGTVSGTALGGTFTTVATAPTARVALYNLTLNLFTPTSTAIVNADDAVIPANRKLNNLSLAGNGNGLNLSNNLTLYGTAPLTLTASLSVPGNILNLNGYNLNCTWQGYAGALSTFSATSNTYIKNGSMTVVGRGGGLTGSSYNFPFSGYFSCFTGTGTGPVDGANILTVKVTETTAPSNTNLGGTGTAMGSRAFRVETKSTLNSTGTSGTNPTVTLRYNSQDGLTTTQDQTFVSEGTSLAGQWTAKTASIGAGGALAATGALTTPILAPGPIALTGDVYYAWSSLTPTISGVAPLILCASSGNFTITGTNLLGVSAVSIGGTPVTAFTVVSATQINGFAGNGTSGFLTIVKNGVTFTGTQSILVNPSPVAPTASPLTTTVLLGGSSTYTATGTGGTYNWYAVPNGGTILYSGSAFTTPPACANTTYYLAENNGSCDGPRSSVTIAVTPMTTSTSIPSFCGTGGTTTLTAAPIDPSITYTWATNTPSVVFNSNVGSSVTATLTQTSEIYLTSTVNGCTAVNYFSVGVYPLPASNMTTTASSVCTGTPATIGSGLSSSNFAVSSIPYLPYIIPNDATYICSNGVPVVPLSGGSLDDGGWGNIPIGFSFNFFGNSYSNLAAGTNGLLMFGTVPGYGTAAGQLGQFTFNGGPVSGSYQYFPNPSNPGNVISLMAGDQYFGSGTNASATSDLIYWTSGYAPNRVFNILYQDVNRCCGVANPSFTAYARLFETIGNVEIHILNNNQSTNTNVVGLQDLTKTIGAVAPGRPTQNQTTGVATAWGVTTPEAWRFVPPANYATVWTATNTSGVASTLATGTNIFNQTLTPTETANYTISYTNQTTGCSAISAPVTITFNAVPSAPTATNSTQCGPTIPTAAVASSAGVAGSGLFNWFSASTGGTLLQSPPIGAYTSFYFNDFANTTINAGATLSGTANLTAVPGALELFPNATSMQGGITVAAGINANAYKVEFDVTTTTGADGFSYSFGNDVDATATAPAQEKGSGTKLKIGFDSYGVMPDGAGIYLMYNNTMASITNAPLSAGVLGYDANTSWSGSSNNHVVIETNNAGQVTLTLNGTPIFTNVQLPAAYVNANKASWAHVIAGRTGGISSQVIIDNLDIKTAVQIPGSTTYTSTVTATSTFYVSEVGTNGCTSSTTPITVTVLTPDPIIVTPGTTTALCEGGSITLGASSVANPPYTYTWDANTYNGSGFAAPIASTGTTITPSAPGVYTYTVTGISTLCTATQTVVATINANPVITSATASPSFVCNDNLNVALLASAIVSGPQTMPSYCAITGYGGTGTMINNVSFGTINNNSSASNPTALPYYTSYPLTTNVALGSTYPLSVTMGPAGTYLGGIVSVWIDYNRDGTYSAAEWQQVNVYALGGSTTTINITIPATAQVGLTGMRIRSRGNGNINGAGNGCTLFGSGEGEDYQVNIQGAPSVPYNFTWATTPVINTAAGSVTVANATTLPITQDWNVTATNSVTGCIGTATTNTVSIQPAIVSPTTVDGSHCGLQASAAAATDVNGFTAPIFNWYATATSVTPLQSSTANTYTTPIATTTTFYVSVTNPISGCETGRTAVTETVTPAAAFAITSAFTACQNLSYPITVTTGLSNFTNFVWSGATSLFLDAAMTIPYVSGTSATTVYYASGALGAQPSIICNATDAGVGFAQCASTASTIVSIQATPVTPIIGAAYTTICTGTSAALNVLSGGAYCSSNATTIYDEEITVVSLGSLYNTSDCFTPAAGPGSILNRYSNFTTSVGAANMAAGSTINGSIEVASCGTFNYSSGLAVFIDYNQDGDFLDAGEKVYSNGAAANIACVPATTVPVTYTIPLGTLNGQTRMRIINAEFTAGDNITPCYNFGYGETEDYVINITGGLSNSYVWSPAVTNNSTAPSVTSLPLTAQTSFTATLFDGLCYSAPSAPLVIDIAVTPTLAITAAVPVSGYCNSGAFYTNDEEIFNVTIGTLNNTSNCLSLGTGPGSLIEQYANYTSGAGMPGIPNLVAGSTNTGSVEIGTCGFYNYTSGLAVFVDFNQDGDFIDAGEKVYSNGAAANINCLPSSIIPISVTIPSTAINGQTRMRVVNQESYSGDNISPCTVQSWGETEDYLINITNGVVSTPCPGTTFTLNSTVGLGGPPYTYAWSVVSGTATIAAPTNANTTAVIDLDAVLQLIVTDACGSSTTTTVATDVLDNPITITPAASAICYNSNTVLTANNGNTFTWLPTTGLVSANGVSVTASPATTTTYTVTGTYGAGCIGTASSVLTVNQLPTVNAGVDQTLCSNVPAILSGSGTSGVVYTWTNNVVNNVPFAVSATNNYIVTGTDINNCINTDTVSINVLAIPNVNAGLDQSTCTGGAITLNATATGNTSLSWNNGVTNGVTFTPTSSQNYIVTVQAANGCYDYDTVAVNMNAAPLITLTNGATACANGTTTLTASTNNAFGGFWSTTNGNGVITPNISNNTMVYAPGINDPATVNITYIAFNGCGNASQNTTIGVLPIPNVNGGQDVSACTGVSVTLNATATGATSLTWSGGVTNGVAFTPASAQNYIVTALAANGCLDHDTVAVLFNAGPVITLSTANATCANGSATLTATTNNAFGGYWSTSNGSGVITPNVTSNTMIYTPALNDPSTVNISYTANNSCGNASQSTTLTVYQVPTLNAGNDVVVCSGDLVTLNATTNGTLTWNNNVVNGTPFFANAGNTTYTATATNANNCTTTDQVIVTGNALPPVSAGPDFSVCPGGTATLSGTGAATYTWNNGVTNGVGFTLTTGGQYTVTGTDAFGCVATDMVVLSITNVNAQVVFIDPVTLLGNPSNAVSFQWINCTTGAILPGETDDTLRVTVNGNYAVIVTTAAGCVDTSACAVVDQVGIFTSDYLNVSLYPNPTNGMVTIQIPNNEAAKLTVFDAQGKLINTVSTVNNGGTVDLSMYTPGVYTFKLQIGDFVHIERIIKN